MNLLVALALFLPILSIFCVNSLEESLDLADQRLNALTHRVLSLSNRLDMILKDRTDKDIQAKYFSRKLDRKEGNATI